MSNHRFTDHNCQLRIRANIAEICGTDSSPQPVQLSLQYCCQNGLNLQYKLYKKGKNNMNLALTLSLEATRMEAAYIRASVNWLRVMIV
jgi:hypothetical protein